MILLLFRIFIPAKELAAYAKFLWDWKDCHPDSTVYYVYKEPQKDYPFQMPFYDHPNRRQRFWYTDPIYKNDTTALQAGDLMFFTTYSFSVPAAPPGFKFKCAYEYYPSWLLVNNTNNWQSRSRIWVIYELQQKD